MAEASGLFAVVTCLRRTGRILCGVTLTRSQVRDLLGRFDIRPKRSLGQHFVVEPNTVRRIVELAEIGSGDRVLEVGPGLGALILALLETPKSLFFDYFLIFWAPLHHVTISLFFHYLLIGLNDSNEGHYNL